MKNSKTALIIAIFLSSTVLTYSEISPGDSSAQATLTNDSLPVAIQKVQDSLPSRFDTITLVNPLVSVKTKKDTIILVTDKEEIGRMFSSISTTVKKSRIQGYGGAGGFGPRIAAFNMDPIVEIMQNSDGIVLPTLKNGYTMIGLSGGLGYGGLGNGIRIGGGGWGGSKKYVSRPFRRVVNAAQDSVAVVSVGIGFGGLLIEKAFVQDNWNILAGGMIGGGGLSADVLLKPAKGGSAFTNTSLSDEANPISAGLMTLELHGGATYTIVPWLHVGGDASIMMYNAINGFESSYSNSFYGVMPSLGIRIIFGNLG